MPILVFLYMWRRDNICVLVHWCGWCTMRRTCFSRSNHNVSSSPRRWCVVRNFVEGWIGLSYLANALHVYVHQTRKGHIKSIDFVCWRMREYENKRRSKRMAEFWENSVCINFEKTAYYFENINLISIRSTSRNHVSCLLLIHVAVICIIRSVKS